MRTRAIVLVIAALVSGMPAGASAAKRCRLLCREQVRACVAHARGQIVCAGQTGHDRRDCQRTLHAAIRTCKSMRGPILAGCKEATSAETCSPSGAFLDTGSAESR